ncbi:MAG TPA: response regulator [Chloroflexi bacterium]|nr:response regulator [Chloroflexota bacterium]
MTIAFVIDDNRQTADSMCDMLKLLGIEAYPVYGSRTAMLALTKKTPDLIFMDINMPGVSGFEVLSYVRREPRLQHIPVIMVTSDDQPQTAQRAQETGALLTMIKPVDIDALERILTQVGLLPPSP